MKNWLKAIWIFLIITIITQILKSCFSLSTAGKSHFVLIQLYNLIFIFAYFFAGWLVYKKNQSFLQAMSAAVVILVISRMMTQVITLLLLAKFHYHLMIGPLMNHVPALLLQELLYLPMAIILGYLGASVCRQRGKKAANP
jgi:hypothetical protein